MEKKKREMEVPFGWVDFGSHLLPVGVLAFEVWCFDRYKTIFPAFFISYVFFPFLDYMTPLDFRNPTPQ